MARLSYGKRNAIRQAIDMQRLYYTGAQLLDQDLRAGEDLETRARVATALGSLLKNWSALGESIRILRNIPAPVVFDQSQPNQVAEPLFPEPASAVGLIRSR